MARPSKKEIKAALDKLRPGGDQGRSVPTDYNAPSLESEKKNQRIRKKGI